MIIKNKKVIAFVVLLIIGLVYYFYTPDINEKKLSYFEKAKDSIIAHHHYFMTHNIEPMDTSTNKIIYSEENSNFVTNKKYFHLLKKTNQNTSFLQPITALFDKGLIIDSDDSEYSNSLYINSDSTIQFIIYEKKRLEGCKIGYLIFDPKEKLKVENGLGHYNIKLKKDGWRFIKAVEPYLNND